MASTDHQPLSDAPVTARIRAHASNRLGAVYSALYCFWSARHATATAIQETLGARFYSTLHTFLSGRPATAIVDQQTTGTRRDAYSVILFNQSTQNALINDLTSSPDQLLGALLGEQAEGGTDFSSALRAGEAIMVENWSPERTPIMIFLSDGECSVPVQEIQDVCRSAVRHGKPLSFHAVSFGQECSNHALRQMAEVALNIQNDAFRRPKLPTLPSSFTTALDTVRLAEAFLGIAESLRKPRGSLVC
ncbi:hypothetical protein BGY98DRAFT_965777 [Russula aff. rugulosa BPL654]|nr:hypothetical protein BGY98DRAFT_965777 [Russula aff. rugulosa BPL654]